MPKIENLKTKNLPLVGIFIIWCVSIYVVFLSYPDINYKSIELTFQSYSAKDCLLIAILPLLILCFSGMIGAENKARLVFMRVHNALPGHRAFSVFARIDPRINLELLVEKLGSLPIDPKAQNVLWYSLYKQCSDNIIIKQSHKDFLLARDISSIAFLFFVFGSICHYMTTYSLKSTSVYACVMLIQYLAFATVAKNNGNRFVCNVLAIFSDS